MSTIQVLLKGLAPCYTDNCIRELLDAEGSSDLGSSFEIISYNDETTKTFLVGFYRNVGCVFEAIGDVIYELNSCDLIKFVKTIELEG